MYGSLLHSTTCRCDVGLLPVLIEFFSTPNCDLLYRWTGECRTCGATPSDLDAPTDFALHDAFMCVIYLCVWCVCAVFMCVAQVVRIVYICILIYMCTVQMCDTTRANMWHNSFLMCDVTVFLALHDACMLHACVATCCSVLQFVAMCCSVL